MLEAVVTLDVSGGSGVPAYRWVHTGGAGGAAGHVVRFALGRRRTGTGTERADVRPLLYDMGQLVGQHV